MDAKMSGHKFKYKQIIFLVFHKEISIFHKIIINYKRKSSLCTVEKPGTSSGLTLQVIRSVGMHSPLVFLQKNV